MWKYRGVHRTPPSITLHFVYFTPTKCALLSMPARQRVAIYRFQSVVISSLGFRSVKSVLVKGSKLLVLPLHRSPKSSIAMHFRVFLSGSQTSWPPLQAWKHTNFTTITLPYDVIKDRYIIKINKQHSEKLKKLCIRLLLRIHDVDNFI
jgi:hypothetical protein